MPQSTRTLERALVFIVGITVGGGIGFVTARSIYHGVGYEIFKQDELADVLEPGPMPAENADVFSDVIDASAAPETPLAEGAPEDLSEQELEELKKLVLPRLKEADIEEWKKGRTTASAPATQTGEKQ